MQEKKSRCVLILDLYFRELRPPETLATAQIRVQGCTQRSGYCLAEITEYRQARTTVNTFIIDFLRIQFGQTWGGVFPFSDSAGAGRSDGAICVGFSALKTPFFPPLAADATRKARPCRIYLPVGIMERKTQSVGPLAPASPARAAQHHAGRVVCSTRT
jgi:hypothetical protein